MRYMQESPLCIDPILDRGAAIRALRVPNGRRRRPINPAHRKRHKPRRTCATEINAVMRSLIEDTPGARGAAVAVVKGSGSGRRVYSRGYGTTNLEPDYFGRVAVTAQMKFRVDSVTKVVTALCLLLVEKHPDWFFTGGFRFNIDEPVLFYWPQLLQKVPVRCAETFKSVTVRQLMSMSSGVSDIRDTSYARSPYMEFIDVSVGLGLIRSPGQIYNYSDAAYMILGVVLDQLIMDALVGGNPGYAAFAKKYVFDVLEMHDTYISESLLDPDVSIGYLNTGVPVPAGQRVPPSHSFSGGAMVSTADDLVKLRGALDLVGPLWTTPQIRGSSYIYSWPQRLRMQPEGGTVNSPFLSPGGSGCFATVREMIMEPYYFCLGWYTQTINGSKYIWKNGDLPGSSACIYIDTVNDIVVSIVINVEKAPVDAAAQNIIAAMVDCRFGI